MSVNYYQILGIDENVSPDQVKKAYRRLALQYHPDKGGSEAKFKEIAEAYEVLSDQATRKKYDETGSAPPKTSRGGIEAPKVFDYAARKKLDQEIDNALKRHNIGAHIFGKEIYPLHSDCNANVGIHILVCLETETEAWNFKNQALNLIEKFATELKQLREEVISRLENHYSQNEKYLSAHQKNLWKTLTLNSHYTGASLSWKEYVRQGMVNSKELLTDFEDRYKRMIDTFAFKGGSGWDESKYEEELRKINEKYSNKDKNGKYYKTGDASDKSERIAQLEKDIKHLKKDLSDPKLTEKEKVEVQEKLNRFEKELAELENKSTPDKNQSDKDKKAKRLEEEIKQLKNQKPRTPQEREENQKKIAEKEQELENIRKNGQDIDKSQRDEKARTLEAEIRDLRNRNSDKSISSEQKRENERKIAEKEQELAKIKQGTEGDRDKPSQNASKTNQKPKSDSILPIGGVSLVAIFLTVLLVKRAKRIAKKKKKRKITTST